MNDEIDESGDSDCGPVSDRTRFEWSDTQPPSMAVCEGVAAVLGVEPTELAPLGDSIDGEALDRIVDPTAGPGDGPVSLQFEYEGVDVFIDSERTVELRIPSESVDGKNPP